MKKFLITCFYLALTLAVCAVSFLLPSTLNTYQDNQIFAKIEHTAMDPPDLTYSTSLYDTLRLLCGSHYFVDYPSTGSKRSSEEIYQTASDLVGQLSEYSILNADAKDHISNYEATLQLAIESEKRQSDDVQFVSNTRPDNYEYDAQASDGQSEDDSLAKEEETSSSDIATAVVWLCSVTFDSGHWITLRIDDKSGKVVSMSISSERVQTMTSSGCGPELDAFASSVAAFLEDYFEMPADPQKQDMIQSYSYLYDKSSISFEATYLIQLKKEDGTLLELPLHIYPDSVMLGAYHLYSTSFAHSPQSLVMASFSTPKSQFP